MVSPRRSPCPWSSEGRLTGVSGVYVVTSGGGQGPRLLSLWKDEARGQLAAPPCVSVPGSSVRAESLCLTGYRPVVSYSHAALPSDRVVYKSILTKHGFM